MRGAAVGWHGVVEGDTSGSIRFAIEAQPDADLPTNRTGLCVLHPLSAAGGRLEIEHADGRLSQSTFPTLISPWQPFTQIRALRHEFLQGCWARCRLDGDVFEMEDQRNFSDASYKTYSRSNLMPRPYRLAAGERIRQSATLTLEACEPAGARTRTPDPCVEITRTRTGRMPRAGGSMPARGRASGQDCMTSSAPPKFPTCGPMARIFATTSPRTSPACGAIAQSLRARAPPRQSISIQTSTGPTP